MKYVYFLYLSPMDQTIQLPAPSNFTRQTALGVQSPTLSRSLSVVSQESEIRTPDETMRHRLTVYKTHLEHELTFLDSEINALIQRPVSQNPAEDAAFLELRNSLKIRYNNTHKKLSRARDLLEVLE